MAPDHGFAAEQGRDPGRSGADNRLFVNGVLWVLRSGTRWQDLPEQYGKWKSVHKRSTRWAKAATSPPLPPLLAGLCMADVIADKLRNRIECFFKRKHFCRLATGL